MPGLSACVFWLNYLLTYLIQRKYQLSLLSWLYLICWYETLDNIFRFIHENSSAIFSIGLYGSQCSSWTCGGPPTLADILPNSKGPPHKETFPLVQCYYMRNDAQLRTRTCKGLDRACHRDRKKDMATAREWFSNLISNMHICAHLHFGSVCGE